MGLIKTAILTGGGIYAIRKITKSAETRQSSSSSPAPNYPPQQGPLHGQDQRAAQGGYWGPPPPPRNAHYEGGKNGGVWYPQIGSSQGVFREASPARNEQYAPPAYNQPRQLGYASEQQLQVASAPKNQFTGFDEKSRR